MDDDVISRHVTSQPDRRGGEGMYSWRPIFQIVQKRAVQKIQINAKQIQINAKQIQINTKNFSKIHNSQN